MLSTNAKHLCVFGARDTIPCTQAANTLLVGGILDSLFGGQSDNVTKEE